MHDLSIRIPLIVFDPRHKRGNRGGVISQQVLNIDIAPTLLELAGINIPSEIQGRSLVPLLEGTPQNWRTEILTEHLWDHPDIPQTEAVRTEKWKYIRYPQHPEFEELYALQQDPTEANNLAFDQRFSHIRDELSKRFDR
jgi:arylsulfatase A-like enzyme